MPEYTLDHKFNTWPKQIWVIGRRHREKVRGETTLWSTIIYRFIYNKYIFSRFQGYFFRIQRIFTNLEDNMFGLIVIIEESRSRFLRKYNY